MVFSSYPFILAFLPAVVLLALCLRRAPPEAVIILLAAASLCFYAYWDWRFLWVIGISVLTNYAIGLALGDHRPSLREKLILMTGIGFNLCLLGYFKYANFFLDNIQMAFASPVLHLDVVLPLGISFFTFQQIAYLIDVHQRKVVEHDFRHYLLFVTFFPQLIAGPIVHHREMMPQFVAGRAGRVEAAMFAQGLAIFVIGVAKKVLIADRVARYATPVFDASANGVPIPLLEGWAGTLAYAFQIYFDFSAYSDMAVGLGLMFGLRLPVNFNSPYKAVDLIDFWRRWHITLSRFLRDYLYIPLGGNRRGSTRRYVNLLAVMLLGGLWHGAAWTFVIWGGLHGLGLTVNHLWRRLRDRSNVRTHSTFRVWRGRVLTFLFVTVAWVFFRAEDLASAMNIVRGMFGLNGVVLPETYFQYLGGLGPYLAESGVRFEAGYLFLGIEQIVWLAVLLAIVTLLPNTLEWARYSATANGRDAVSDLFDLVIWRPTVTWALVLSACLMVSLVLMSEAGEFLYFQF